ncbi:hypothetical protein AB1Y20_016248 [Prymnesium parvum]|uniref:PPIase cyclophilin-type domain-containing protein n=2 Tax=Prymnesium parvum TaxID=97485 RepID=A0AB34IC81_PRYPA
MKPPMVGRRGAALLAAAAASFPVRLPSLAEPPPPARPRPTHRVFLDLRIIRRYDLPLLDEGAVRGRLSISLYGEQAPRAAAQFLDFVDGTAGQFAASGGGPSYASASFFRHSAAMLEAGHIAGLSTTSLAGVREYEYMGRLLPLRPILEPSALPHCRRGLLTRRLFAAGPEFGVTLGAAPALDKEFEVFGEVEGDADAGGGMTGDELLRLVEELPYITGTSVEGEGTVANAVFTAQKNFFSKLAAASGDSRAEDRTGLLLRRVEITACGRL